VEHDELRQLIQTVSMRLDELSCEVSLLSSDVQRIAPLCHQVMRAVGMHLDKSGRIKQGTLDYVPSREYLAVKPD
jgi:hypothetical protein